MSADQPQTETAARRARRRGAGTTSCADTDALASVRDHLLAARADAALALVWPVWAPSGRTARCGSSKPSKPCCETWTGKPEPAPTIGTPGTCNAPARPFLCARAPKTLARTSPLNERNISATRKNRTMSVREKRSTLSGPQRRALEHLAAPPSAERGPLQSPCGRRRCPVFFQ